jgi:hypothetical protein
MSRLLSPLFLVLTLVFLSACTRYEVMVNGFRNVNEPMPIRTTFAIFPVETQKTDLEYQEYARMVEVKMQENGYKKSDINSADIAILLNYGIDEGVTKYSASSGPVYGTRTFSGTATGSGGTTFISGQSSGIVGSQTSVSSHTEYKRILKMEVFNVAKLRADGSVAPIWRGETISRGSRGDLRRVMPYLIEGTFMHFGEDTKMGIRHTIYDGDEAVEKLRQGGP